MIGAILGDAQAAVGGRDVQDEVNGMEEESDREWVEQHSRWRESIGPWCEEGWSSTPLITQTFNLPAS